jgi:hypothetical protein
VRRLSIPMKVAGAVLGMAVLFGMAGMVRKRMKQAPSLARAKAASLTASEPSCTGISSSPSAGQLPSQLNPDAHFVTLSWKAAVPASNSPRDAIKGYYVYRSLTSHAYPESARISKSPLRGTHCIDANVEPRKTYFYIVKSVTGGEEQSASSIEIRAVVPSP